MKTIKLLLVLLIASAANAQCYSKIVSFSRNYIALQTDGTLWSKGEGFDATLGFGNTNAVAEFTQIGTDNNWTDKISLNGVNVFAIKTDGTLWVWGYNYSNGSAGLGSFVQSGPFGPVQIGNDTDWTNVTVGSGLMLAVKTNGTLWACGINNKGQMGIGNTDDLFKTNVLIQVGTETDWSKVYTGPSSSIVCAIKSNGTLWSWGNNGSYIGYDNANLNDSYRVPHQIGTDSWTSIVIGNLTPITYGIKSDGSLWAWGSSNFGMYAFGNGIDIYSSQTPLRIGADSDWKEIHFGQNTTLALKTNGSRWGWGRNGNGHELGMGAAATSDVTIPTQLDADTDWNHLSIDLYSAYGDGIKQNNSLYHWGNTHINVVYASPTLFSATECVLGINDFTTDDNIITVFPNPASDKLTFQFEKPVTQNTVISISNNLGQVIASFSMKSKEKQIAIDTCHFASGLYFITYGNGSKFNAIKFIKI